MFKGHFTELETTFYQRISSYENSMFWDRDVKTDVAGFLKTLFKSNVSEL